MRALLACGFVWSIKFIANCPVASCGFAAFTKFTVKDA